MADSWTQTNPYWQVMNPYQRAAAMSLMETGDPADATNVLGAMVNRARADKADLGVQVGSRVYQPSFEPSQEARLEKIIKSQPFVDLTKKAEGYWTGKEDTPHKATHFLAHEPVMLALERGDPNKYKSWRNWTGYNSETGQYEGVQFRDKSHAFLTPGQRPPVTYQSVEGNPFTGQAKPAATAEAPQEAKPVYAPTSFALWERADQDHSKLNSVLNEQGISYAQAKEQNLPEYKASRESFDAALAENGPSPFVTSAETSVFDAPMENAPVEAWKEYFARLPAEERRLSGIDEVLKKVEKGTSLTKEQIYSTVMRNKGSLLHAGVPLYAKGVPFGLERVDHDPFKHTPASGNPFA